MMIASSLGGLVLAHAAEEAATGGDGGPDGALVLVVAAVMGAGWVFFRIVVPLVRTTVTILERVAEIAVKLGLALMAGGAIAAVVLVLYAMSSLGGSGG
jgi:hypothetical protein